MHELLNTVQNIRTSVGHYPPKSIGYSSLWRSVQWRPLKQKAIKSVLTAHLITGAGGRP